MLPDGSYLQRTPKGHDSRKSCQEQLIVLTEQRDEQAVETRREATRRTRKRKPRRPSVAPVRPSRPPSPLHKLN
jgi:hypothetical protein